MPLSEHVYCVAITFRMTEQVEQRICIKVCVKLQHSSMETIRMIQKATAMGKWWLAASSEQHACSCIMSRAEILVKYQITQVTQSPYSPDLVPCDFWLFPKLKSPMKGKTFQTINKIQENMTRQLMGTGRTVWAPKVPTLKGSEASLPCVQCFLCLVSSRNVLFSYYMAAYLLDRPSIYFVFSLIPDRVPPTLAVS